MKRFLSVVSFALLLPTAAYADRSSTNVDFTIGPVFSIGTSASGSNGSGLDIDDGIGFGLGFAYHLNERFALGFETAYIEPDYELRINTEEDGVRVLDHEMTIASFQFNGIWH